MRHLDRQTFDIEGMIEIKMNHQAVGITVSETAQGSSDSGLKDELNRYDEGSSSLGVSHCIFNFLVLNSGVLIILMCAYFHTIPVHI